MNTTATSVEPKLAAPGAGLPAIELLVARTMFRVQRWKHGREHWDKLFESERTEIRRIVGELDDSTAGRQTLVKRIRGLEDSSRFWSVYMVLQHLDIVNKSMLGAIVALTKGVVPDAEVSTADVKPSVDSDRSSVDGFEASCDQFQRMLTKLPDLKTTLLYRHPWFGPLDAAGWLALAAFHMRLHRRQIELIVGAPQARAKTS